jgi:flagellar FliJ protein
MPFRFTLAAVLRYKESLEQQEERALKEIQLKMAHLAHQIEELSTTIEKAATARERALASAIPASHLELFMSATQSTKDKQKALISRFQSLEADRDEQMRKYEVAHRNREMLSDMLEKQKNIYEQEQVQAQQKRLDDIFMARRRRG